MVFRVTPQFNAKSSMGFDTGYNRSGPGAGANVNAAPNNTLLSALAPNLNTAIPTIKPAAIDPNKPGAVDAAQKAQGGLAGVKQEIQNTQAAVGEVIKQAKAEINAACQVNEVPAVAVFPQASMTADSPTELGVGAGTMANVASGALKVASAATTAMDFSAGMKGRAPEEVREAVADTLRASCSPEEGFGLVENGDAAARLDNASAFDWGAVLDDCPEALEAIMYCDLENPNLEFFPELVAMNDAIAFCDQQMEGMDAVVANAPDLAYVSAAACDHMVLGEDHASVIAFDREAATKVTASLGAGVADDIANAANKDAPPPAALDREAELQAIAAKAELDRAPMTPASPMSA